MKIETSGELSSNILAVPTQIFIKTLSSLFEFLIKESSENFCRKSKCSITDRQIELDSVQY